MSDKTKKGKARGQNGATGSQALTTVQASGAVAPVFAAYLPTGCPPSNAQIGPKELFRFFESAVLGPADFLTHHEQGKMPNADPCKRCGLSSFPTKAAAEAAALKVSFLAKQKLCSGTVPACAGKMAPTPSKHSNEHWTWWPAAGVSRHSFFSEVT